MCDRKRFPDAAFLLGAIFLLLTNPLCASDARSPVQISGLSFIFESASRLQPGYDALLVANSQYASVTSLATPNNDVALIGSALQTRGIKSTIINNVSQALLSSALQTFSQSANKELFIFYYAGHAAQINGANAMIFPTFALNNLRDSSSFQDINDIIVKISAMGYKKVLIVFDACRNPLLLSTQSETTAKIASGPAVTNIRGLSSSNVDLRALGPQEYAISFSASEGEFAVDTLDGRDSPYAEAFARSISQNISLVTAVMDARTAVIDATDGKQNPTVTLSWGRDLYLNEDPIKSITVDFLEDKSFDVDLSKVSLVPSEVLSTPRLEIKVPANETNQCITYPGFHSELTNVRLQLFALYNCALRQAGADKSLASKLWSWQQANGGEALLYRRLKIEADFNLDGKVATLEMSTNKYGGDLDYSEPNGLRKTFFSRLGGNVDELYVTDFDGDGYNDFILLFEIADENNSPSQAIVIIGGKKLHRLDAADYACTEYLISDVCARFKSLSRYMVSTWDPYVIGGLGFVALFYDEAINEVLRVGRNFIEYRRLKPTYEGKDLVVDSRGQIPSCCKLVSIDALGVIRLKTGEDLYEISPFGKGAVVSRLVGSVRE